MDSDKKIHRKLNLKLNRLRCWRQSDHNSFTFFLRKSRAKNKNTEPNNYSD